jgi:XRE family transcriptional regulator, regulator of sulfur utilization
MIGEKIRKIREFRGYSQEVVAENLGISQPAYSKIETSGTEITFNTLQKLAAIFKIEIDELISFDEKYAFSNTFNENSKGYFNVKKVINENFDKERNAYQEEINFLKEEIIYLRKKLDGDK